MNANNLTWDQIKELAQVAMDNQNEFRLDISKDGDVSIEISKPYNSWYPITTTNPTIPITVDKQLHEDWKPYVWCGDPITGNTMSVKADNTVMPNDFTKVTC